MIGGRKLFPVLKINTIKNRWLSKQGFQYFCHRFSG